MSRPKFMDSEYLVRELFNLHLKEGAPEEVVREFEEWKKRREENKKKESSKTEAISLTFEKMHKENRAWLTQEEWDKMKRLAIDNYPEKQWERDGYGDYSRLDFVRKED